MSVYTPLQKYLFTLPASQNETTLTFEQIEHILNYRLPPSAFNHPAWWANEKSGRHVQAYSWLNVGWQVETFDQAMKMVRFVRNKVK